MENGGIKVKKLFFKSEDMKKENVGAGVDRQILAHGGTLMLVEVEFEEGSVGNAHVHPHEQATYVLAGEFEFTVGEEVSVVKAGDTIYMPANIIHGAKCLKAGKLLDIFTPQREDFLKK